jgi:hypothetical protein
MRGNAIFEPDTPHYKFHQVLEGFWDQFRTGTRKGTRPTNAEYGNALWKALRYAGFSTEETANLVGQAAKQRIAAGLIETEPVPRIPKRINQIGGGVNAE